MCQTVSNGEGRRPVPRSQVGSQVEGAVMTEPERSHLSGKALEAYDRMLERVQARLHDLQETSLQTLEEEVQKAVEFEYELEEMTREEADLLGEIGRASCRERV